MNSNFFKGLLLLLAIVLFSSCDKDYNGLGSDLVGQNHYNLLQNLTSTVTAYNQKTGPVQTNNLDVNAFGVYDNPIFGKTIASYATQLELPAVPVFVNPAGVTIVDVTLNIPYFSHITATDATTGINTYALDSIQGNTATSKFKLSVFANKYFMKDTDITTFAVPEQQRFYSDQSSDFNSNTDGLRLNDGIIFPATTPATIQNDDFVFDPTEHTDTDGTTKLAPSMRFNLRSDYFQTLLSLANQPNFASNAIFKNFMRGLYFKVEQNGANPGMLAMMNFRKGTIKIRYKDFTSSTDNTVITNTIVLNMTGNSVNLIENPSSGTAYESLPSQGNTTTGDDRLYLKGGNGSSGVISIISPAELLALRNSNILVNEANLTFYVDQSKMGTTVYEPNRIFLYDINNRRPIIDYFNDASINTAVNYTKYVHSGLIVRDQITNRGVKYKVRITNYIRSLIKADIDSTNVKIGVSVCQSILNTGFGRLKNIPSAGVWNTYTATQKNAYFFPALSVMNPYGTVLYGNTATVPDDKKLKLEIYYTKPN